MTDEEKILIDRLGPHVRLYYMRQFEDKGCCNSENPAVLALWKDFQLSKGINKTALARKKASNDKPVNLLHYYERTIKEFMDSGQVSNNQVAAGTGLSMRTVQRVKSGESSFKALKLVLTHLREKGMRDIVQERIIDTRRALWGK